MTTNLSNLKLNPSVLLELRQRGYETAEDMAHLTIAESLRIPGVGGRDWRKIAAAQGRPPIRKLRAGCEWNRNRTAGISRLGPSDSFTMTITRQTLLYQAAASRFYADAWTVLDIFTGLPIVIGGIVMDGLSAEQVNDLVDELNHEDLEMRGKLKPGP